MHAHIGRAQKAIVQRMQMQADRFPAATYKMRREIRSASQIADAGVNLEHGIPQIGAQGARQPAQILRRVPERLLSTPRP